MSFYRTPGKSINDPTEHQGLGHPNTWLPGATCEKDIKAYDDEQRRVWRQPPLVGTVPGGSKDTIEHRMHMDFDKDMDAYLGARKEGLQPKQTTMKAVKEAQAEVTSQTKALKVADSVGFEFGPDTKLAPGVDRDLLVH